MFRGVQQAGVRDLERHHPVQLGVAGAPHRPEGADAHALQELELAQPAWLRGRGEGLRQPFRVQVRETAAEVLGPRVFAAETAVVDFQRDQLTQQGRPLGVRRAVQVVFDARGLRRLPGRLEAVTGPVDGAGRWVRQFREQRVRVLAHDATSSAQSLRMISNLRVTVRGVQPSRAAISSWE
jgi:hypothetical protein